jgi:hypothetical protein
MFTTRDAQVTMVSRVHRVKQLKSNIPGIEAMTLVSSHHFPRHSHEQFGIGVMVSGPSPL